MDALIVIYVVFVIAFVSYMIFTKESGHVPGVKIFFGIIFVIFSIIYWLSILVVKLLF